MFSDANGRLKEIETVHYGCNHHITNWNLGGSLKDLDEVFEEYNWFPVEEDNND
jgi:hypothetical protein